MCQLVGSPVRETVMSFSELRLRHAVVADPRCGKRTEQRMVAAAHVFTDLSISETSLKVREIVAARLSATSLAAFYAFFRKSSSMNLTMPLLTWTGTVTVLFISRTPRLLDCRAFRFGGSNGLSKVAFKQIFFMDIT